MAMALIDHESAVKTRRFSADHQLAGLRAQPHRAAFFRHLRLFVQHGNHRMRSVGIELGRMGVGEFQNVARKFNGGDLHTETEAEVR